MHNKKLKGSIATLALSAVLVGGTFAWLGATDSVKNIFTTTGDEGAKSHIEVYEKKTNDPVTTKSTGNKQVQVQNNSNYNSLIRVNFTKGFENTALNEDGKSEYIQLGFIKDGKSLVKKSSELKDTDTLTSLREEGIHWIQDGEYYYYLGNVAPQGFTTQLLHSVSLSDAAIVDPDPAYRNAQFNVTVHADSIQSTDQAIISTDEGVNQGTEVKGFGLTNKKLIALLSEVTEEKAGTVDQIEGTTGTYNGTIGEDSYQNEDIRLGNTTEEEGLE